jgi:hypothetical protein
MNTLIVYMKSCVKCTERQTWNKLRRYANRHGLAIEERRTGLSKQWRDEAGVYRVALPFVVQYGKATALNAFVKDLEGK